MRPDSILSGAVLGVIAGDIPERERTLLLQDLKVRGLGGVEIRADLFPDHREAVGALRALPRGVPALFTVRHQNQGGAFRGGERERADLYRAGVAAGAELIDAEWGTEAARVLLAERQPVLLSWHDFRGMPSETELAEITRAMASLPCRAIKVVTTARGSGDALRMIRWVGEKPREEPPRIGFAMGEPGFGSRVLAIAHGSPVTYAALGTPVSPGQVSAIELLEIYRPQHRTRSTRVLGVAGNPVGHSLSPHLHNPALQARGIDAVYLPFLFETWGEALLAIDALGIDGLSITIPFKEDALRTADRADARSRAAGAANTLKIERDAAGRRTAIAAFNTDVEGVLGPLRRRVGELRGLEAAVIGNGGAARGAVRALLEAGARPTLFYRNEERGGPVARSLGVPGRHLSVLAQGRPAGGNVGPARGGRRVILNATPLGLRPDDPSPVDPAAFSAETIAFEMVYSPPWTRFLEDARAAGATCIPGREMLVAQAVEQFRIFTGQPASQEELDANFERGLALRRRG